MRPERARIGRLVALAMLAVLAGCAPKHLAPVSRNTPPETSVFVRSDGATLPDTVNHVVHLYWYGNDADGYVRAYRVRLVNPADPVAADSAWGLTTALDSLVTIYTPAGYTTATFEVAAVDDKGQIDPSPAIQQFQFNNHPPIVRLTTKPNRADR